MQIDRRITNGLAWAGVVLVVGIPLADLVSGQVMDDPARAQIAMIAPVAPVPAALSERPAAPVAKPAAASVAKPEAVAVVKPAAVAVAKPEAVTKPVVTAAPVQTAATAPAAAPSNGDVVDNYLQTGKALPSYITGAQSAPAATPAVVDAQVPVEAPSATDPVEVAALGPSKVAPVPMPLSMRPEPVLIVDGPARTRDIQAGTGFNPRSSATVTYDDLQDWESGPLSEFLARRENTARVDPNYDPDGFYLDEGPNGGSRRDRLVGPAEGFYLPFVN